MDKMKRFIDCYIPTETCNFRCHYCYIAQHRKFNNEVAKFNYTPQYIAKALSKDRLGGICMFNLCAGGETFISEEIIDIVRAILKEGHYVMIVTNGSLTERFKKIAEFPRDLLKRLFFKFSFHYLELVRLKMIDRFFDNIKMMRDAGASFTIEITPNDELETYIDEIKNVMMEKIGALPHVTIGRKDTDDIPILTNHEFEEYKKIWNQFSSEMFDYKSTIFGEKRNEFCYAGEWSIYLNLVTGDYTQCYYGKKIGNIYDNIDKPIKFLPVGCNCSQPHCYNGHAFLTFGNIPELKSPTYDILRNRIQSDGNEWLQPEMKTFMQSKLVETNKQYSEKEKIKINKKNMRYTRNQKIKATLKNIIKRNYKNEK